MEGLKLDNEISENYSSLHDCNCQGTEQDIQRMERTLELDADALERPKMPFLSSPLREAAACGHIACVTFLLSRGANVESEDRRGSTPVDAAVIAGHATCVLALLQAGANPNHRPFNNPKISRTNCLSKACTNGNLHIAKLLLEHGAMTEDIPEETPDLLLVTPASLAVTQGHHQCLRLLLLYGAVIDLSTVTPARPQLVSKHSLPHLAVLHSSRLSVEVTKRTLQYLRDFGANFYKLDQKGDTALQVLHTKYSGETETIEQLKHLLQYYMDVPLNLISLSRLKILQILGRRYETNIKYLDIPTVLLEFLYFK